MIHNCHRFELHSSRTVLKNTSRVEHPLIEFRGLRKTDCCELEVISTSRFGRHYFLILLNLDEDVTVADAELVIIPFKYTFTDFWFRASQMVI